MNWMKLVHYISRKELFKIFWVLIALIIVKVLMLAGFSLIKVDETSDSSPAYRQAQQGQPQKGDKDLSRSVKQTLDMKGSAHAQENEQKSSDTNKAEGKGDLSEQWQKLRKKQEELRRKEEELKNLEKEIDKKLAKQKELKQKLENVLEEARSMKDEKIKHLVDVYSNMQPDKAAQALETLKKEIAVKILAGMQGRTAGEILSFVESEKAARLSEALTDFQTPFED